MGPVGYLKILVKMRSFHTGRDSDYQCLVKGEERLERTPPNIQFGLLLSYFR